MRFYDINCYPVILFTITTRVLEPDPTRPHKEGLEINWASKLDIFGTY